VTILMIDDELGRMVGDAARAHGKTLEEFATEALRRAICESGGGRRIIRNGISVMLIADERAATILTRSADAWRTRGCDRLAGCQPADRVALEQPPASRGGASLVCPIRYGWLGDMSTDADGLPTAFPESPGCPVSIDCAAERKYAREEARNRAKTNTPSRDCPPPPPGGRWHT
jgi:hypothetical protein